MPATNLTSFMVPVVACVGNDVDLQNSPHALLKVVKWEWLSVKLVPGPMIPIRKNRGWSWSCT